MASTTSDQTQTQFLVTTAPTDHEATASFLRCPAPPHFSDMNDDDLLVLVLLAAKALQDHNAVYPSVPPLPKLPAIWDSAKLGQNICSGLKPRYNVSPTELIPTLNAIHIRHQSKVWYEATFLMQNGQSINIVRLTSTT
jgi:hypothetical protein